MREIVIDIETTGLDPVDGHRNPSLIPISISERGHATSRHEPNPTIRHPMCCNELTTEVKLLRDMRSFFVRVPRPGPRTYLIVSGPS